MLIGSKQRKQEDANGHILEIALLPRIVPKYFLPSHYHWVDGRAIHEVRTSSISPSSPESISGQAD